MIKEYQNQKGPRGIFDKLKNEKINIQPRASLKEVRELTGMVFDDEEEEEEDDNEDKDKDKEKNIKANKTKSNKKEKKKTNKNTKKKGKKQTENDNEEDQNDEEEKEPNQKSKKKSKKPTLPPCLEDKESELPNQEEKEITVVVIGDQKCGKSSLIMRYTENEFQTKTKQTTGIIENKTKTATIEGKNIGIKFVDTPGIPNNKYTKIIQEQIAKAHIVLYVFDLGEEDPLFKIKINCWNFSLNSKSLKVIVGNKLDQQTSYSEDNKNTVSDYCKEMNYLWDFISCAEFTQELFDKWFEMKVIPEYFIRKNHFANQ